jgi:hypothetical protein
VTTDERLQTSNNTKQSPRYRVVQCANERRIDHPDYLV